ncbi:MAG: hypothetical protein AUI36_13775 [Cyanobacteria bacterium 13_1_40CM_2_61_4]|nr:MAG: hypothetical protein AUI36_13775 [Cyanobacteria bacterium 13_1_40CM_2_61_4]
MAHESNLDKLIKMRFVECGEWTAHDGQLTAKLLKCADEPKVLYAFVVDGMVVYIGKTIRSLRSRMQGYRSPGKTQFTNIRNNAKVLQALNSGKRVLIYVLPDNGLLSYGGFHVNLAAGLEDDLVKQLSPPWNGGKKDTGESPSSVPAAS